jgi:DNA-binding CsgD family transcriptional regulator
LKGFTKAENSIFIQKAAITCYFCGLMAFTLIVLFNQLENIKHHYTPIIFIDISSLVIVWGVFGLYRLGKASSKFGSAVLAYTTFTNLIISNFFFYYNTEATIFTNIFLICTIIFCANIALVGFCAGRIHLFISGGYYIVSYIALLFVSHDNFLISNAFILIIVILTFSFGFSAFLLVLDKVLREELGLKQKLHEKEAVLIRERAEKLRLELEIKQKELTLKGLYILKQVESNNSFVSKLKELKKDLKASGLKQFYSILSEHEITKPENYWKEFETSFQAVHKNFYKNLQIHFPELTPAERRMAAFIRLDLSTKQIADIISNSIHSVEVARSRLRKKLNLNTQTNLKDFLNNY